MNDPIVAHVGERIRLYRKAAGLSAGALAALVGKSKASVSKYESGKMAIDVETLFRIAAALGISPDRLVEGALPQKPPAAYGKNPFGEAKRLYGYHLAGGKVYTSVLELAAEKDGAIPATLFYKTDDVQNPRACGSVYHGQMLLHDFVVSLILQNTYNPAEQVLMNVTVPLAQTEVFTGMISGLGADTLRPTALKLVLSAARLQEDEPLRALLAIAPESFKEMRRKNTLFIPLG